ncbi:MAG: hypothetical protein NTAFB09_22000 [Nitrosospira sp.]
MAGKGIDLATYQGVKKNALAIYAHTGPSGDMPPDVASKWSLNRRQTFLNWIMKGYPLGVATLGKTLFTAAMPARLRKNVNSLTPQEVETLKIAFSELMRRDPLQSDSYFALAGLHGLPQAWCAHHIDQYNPWHRVLLVTFEDALRSVPGCEEITLPYWDISTRVPSLLAEEPFANYKLPLDPGVTSNPPQPGVFFPYTTHRNSPAEIENNVIDFGVLEDIETSKVQTLWGTYNVGGYQKFSIQAHDGGHGAIGPTMSIQEVAAFDPIFWFFHCNLDRLWLNWQKSVGATTLNGFKSTITGDITWLDGPPPLNSLMPFKMTSDQSLDVDVDYMQEPVSPAEHIIFENRSGNMNADRSFKISRSAPISVRVKDIARLNIPGSFVVLLLADGKPIAKRAFFQPNAPKSCPTCVKQELVNIDFRVDLEKVFDRKLSVTIEVPSQGEKGTRFPFTGAGNPTINARLLLDDQTE